MMSIYSKDSCYSMDTCCLIYAMRQAYPLSNFPAFWENLKRTLYEGKIKIIESVRDEINSSDDDLTQWFKSLDGKVFAKVDNQIISNVQEIVQKCPRLINTQQDRDEADPYVISLAMVHNGTVVTQENLAKSIRPEQKKIKIPNACKDLGVPCINLTEMIKLLGWVFS